MKNKTISTSEAPAAIGPYSVGVIAQSSNLVFISGQLPVDPQTGEFSGSDIKSQTWQSLKNVEAILKANQMSKENVCKAVVYLTDIQEFSQMNEVYAEFFGDTKPARSAFQVAALPKNAKVEIEVIAA